MEMITHEFTDSLASFLIENPALNERDWLKQLNQDELSRLSKLLFTIVKGSILFEINIDEYINKITDAHLLAFRVNNIGRKRYVSRMMPEKQINLLNRILEDVQLTLASSK